MCSKIEESKDEFSCFHLNFKKLKSKELLRKQWKHTISIIESNKMLFSWAEQSGIVANSNVNFEEQGSAMFPIKRQKACRNLFALD